MAHIISLMGAGFVQSPKVNVSLVNTENRSTTEFVREWTAVFDIRPLANNWGLENSNLMREQGQVNLKPVLSDFARRKWGVIWRLGNPTEKRAQILTGTGQNQFTKDTS